MGEMLSAWPDQGYTVLAAIFDGVLLSRPQGAPPLVPEGHLRAVEARCAAKTGLQGRLVQKPIQPSLAVIMGKEPLFWPEAEIRAARRAAVRPAPPPPGLTPPPPRQQRGKGAAGPKASGKGGGRSSAKASSSRAREEGSGQSCGDEEATYLASDDLPELPPPAQTSGAFQLSARRAQLLGQYLELPFAAEGWRWEVMEGDRIIVAPEGACACPVCKGQCAACGGRIVVWKHYTVWLACEKVRVHGRGRAGRGS